MIRSSARQEGLDFVGAIEWLADRFRVPLEYEEVSPGGRRATPAPRAAPSRCSTRPRSFYERYLWDSGRRRASRATTSQGRGLGEEVCREFRLGLSPPAGARSRGRRARRASRATSCAPPGSRTAAAATTSSGASLPARRRARPRARLPGPAAPRGRPAAGEVRELAGGRALPQGRDRSTASTRRARRSPSEDRAFVVEGNTDVIALRQAGFEPVVASMGTALTEQQLRELGRLTRSVSLCFDGDAAGEAATLRGMELAVAQGFDVHVVALPAGRRPGRRPADASRPARDRRELSGLPRAARDRARAGPAAGRSSASSEFLARVSQRLARAQDAVRLAADRLGCPSSCRPASPGGARREPAASRRSCSRRATGSSATRSPASSRIPALAPLLAELTPEHFDLELHRRVREHLLDPGGGRQRARRRRSPSSTRGGRRGDR